MKHEIHEGEGREREWVAWPLPLPHVPHHTYTFYTMGYSSIRQSVNLSIRLPPLLCDLFFFPF